MAPSSSSDIRLLERFRPLLVYDLQEEHRAITVESLVENPGNVLLRGNRVLAEAGGAAGGGLTLELLRSMSVDGTAREEDRVSQVSAAAAMRFTQEPARYPACAYGRVVEDGDFIWLQYWLWFYFRLGNMFGWRQHQGGWELMQIGLDRAKWEPRVVCAKQGDGACAAGWEEVARWECPDPCHGSCTHPVANVRLFTHAIHFDAAPAASLRPRGPASAPERRLPEIRMLEGWNDWPGRWGATTISQFGFGKSPRAPAHQKRGWQSAAQFHRKARNRKRALWGNAFSARPAPPSIEEVVGAGAEMRVTVTTPRVRLHRARWLFVTVHEAEHGRVIRKRIARAGKDGVTSLSIPLLDRDAGVRLFVAVSAFDRWRRRSHATKTDALRRASQESPRRGFAFQPSRAVQKRFHRTLLAHLEAHGALSLAGLRRTAPRVLDLSLNGPEVEALLDSARRHGLVESLPPAAERTAGAGETEWAPTERGRAKIGGPAQLGFGLAKLLPVALIVPVVTELSKNLDTTGDVVLAISAGIGALFLLLLLSLAIHRRSQGALPRRIALEWSRHAVELPALNRWYRRPARNALYCLGALVVVALAAGTMLSAFSPAGGTLGMAAVALLYAVNFLIFSDLIRVGALRAEALDARAADDRITVRSHGLIASRLAVRHARGGETSGRRASPQSA
jgi:hypothetical protein